MNIHKTKANNQPPQEKIEASGESLQYAPQVVESKHVSKTPGHNDAKIPQDFRT